MVVVCWLIAIVVDGVVCVAGVVVVDAAAVVVVVGVVAVVDVVVLVHVDAAVIDRAVVVVVVDVLRMWLVRLPLPVLLSLLLLRLCCRCSFVCLCVWLACCY